MTGQEGIEGIGSKTPLASSDASSRLNIMTDSWFL